MSDFADLAHAHTTNLEKYMVQISVTPRVLLAVWLDDDGRFGFKFGETPGEALSAVPDKAFCDGLWLLARRGQNGWVVDRGEFGCLSQEAKQQLIELVVAIWSAELDASVSRHPASRTVSA